MERGSGGEALHAARWSTLSAGRARRVPAAIAIPALLTAALVAVPLLYVFVRAFERGLAHYGNVLAASDAGWLIARTVLLVAGVVIATTGIALPAAWLVTRSDLPGRRVWAVLIAAPLLFPSYIAAFAIVATLGPRGTLQGLLARAGMTTFPDLAYGYSGALLSLTLFSYPYLFLLLIASFRQIDPALEEASRLLGRSRWSTFLHVDLPQLRPALYGGSLLIVLYVLSDFGAVSIVRYNTFTLAIYNAYRGLFDRTVAAALATLLVVLTLLFIAVEVGLLRKVRAASPAPHRPRQQVTLGRWRPFVFLFLLMLVVTGTGIPMSTIFDWTWRAIVAAAPAGPLVTPAINSAAVSALAAIATVALSIAPTLWAARYRSRTAIVVERTAAAGHALPGIVIALSLVFVATRIAPLIYQTHLLLVAGYVIRFLPEALAAVRSSVLLVPRQVEDAARLLGRGPWNVFLTVTLPLIRRGILAGGSLVFLTTMKELPATLILRPIGFETLATRIWTTAAEGFYAETALPALALVAVSILPVYWFVVRPVLADRTPAEGVR